jgi:hypothetical protein
LMSKGVDMAVSVIAVSGGGTERACQNESMRLTKDASPNGERVAREPEKGARPTWPRYR